MKLKLPSGHNYFVNDAGQNVCTGAMMVRPDNFPPFVNQNLGIRMKMRLVKLEWVDGHYDQGGAYWGNNGVDSVYCAWANLINPASGHYLPFLQVFVWAKNRAAAKAAVREKVPNAVFYR
jgi:hypothetical protein